MSYVPTSPTRFLCDEFAHAMIIIGRETKYYEIQIYVQWLTNHLQLVSSAFK
jgi:hypothetical protein